jgi:hypothetical protein
MDTQPAEIIKHIVTNYHKRLRRTRIWVMGMYFTWSHPSQPMKPGDVATALALRAVCTATADAYSVQYVYINCGGSWGRRQHDDVLRYNSQMWWVELREHAARVELHRLSRRVHWLHWTFDRDRVKANIELFNTQPTAIFDNDKVCELIKTWHYKATSWPRRSARPCVTRSIEQQAIEHFAQRASLRFD